LVAILFASLSTTSYTTAKIFWRYILLRSTSGTTESFPYIRWKKLLFWSSQHFYGLYLETCGCYFSIQNYFFFYSVSWFIYKLIKLYFSADRKKNYHIFFQLLNYYIYYNILHVCFPLKKNALVIVQINRKIYL